MSVSDRLPWSGNSPVESNYRSVEWPGDRLGIPGDAVDNVTNATSPFCVYLMVHLIGGTNVGIWDMVLLIPNAVFLLFLISTICHSARRLKAVSSPVYNTFYVLTFLTCIMGTVRCGVTMSVSGFNSISDQALWLTLRFFQLSTELSVLILGFLFGHLDGRRSTQRVLVITITISLAYVFTQGVLQHVLSTGDILDHNIYAHGGVPFWFGSSLLFLIIYVCVVLLRYIPSLNCCGFLIPVKVRFYYYSAFMACLNLLQTIGSGLVLFTDPDASEGFCLIDITTFCLFSLFPPLIYFIFLWGFFRPGFTSSTERSHLLDVSYNNPAQDDNFRTSVISNGSTRSEKQPIIVYNKEAASSYRKDSRTYPLSYNSLASDPGADDLKDAMLPESLDERQFESYGRSPSTDTTRSYQFRTPLERSFVDSYESINGGPGEANDTDVSDFDNLSLDR